MERFDFIPRFRWIAALACLLLATALLLAQHWGMMFSNADDPWVARASLAAIQKTASEQGRFWLVPLNFISGLPYKLGGWEAGNLVKILVNGFAMLAFALFLYRLVNHNFALLGTLIWLALIDVSHGHYSAFHGYLMMFNLQMGTLFLSLWWYLLLLDRQRKGLAFIGPALLFAFSLLAYEPMLFFFGVYYAVALFRFLTLDENWRASPSWKDKTTQLLRWTLGWLRANWALHLAVAAYLTAYFVYRHFQPTFGRVLDFGGHPFEIARTIFRFSVYGFHFELAPLAQHASESTTPPQLLMAFAFGICIALAGLLVIPMAGESPPETALRQPVGLIITTFFVLAPNLLHGFVDGYRQWAADSPYYVGNYLSSFALAILGALGIGALVGGGKSRQERLLFLLVLYALASSATDNMLKWSRLAQTNRNDAALWTLAITELRHSLGKNSDRLTYVCAKAPPEKVSGDDAFWSYHLSREMGVQIEYRSKRLNSSPCDLIIDFNAYRIRP